MASLLAAATLPSVSAHAASAPLRLCGSTGRPGTDDVIAVAARGGNYVPAGQTHRAAMAPQQPTSARSRQASLKRTKIGRFRPPGWRCKTVGSIYEGTTLRCFRARMAMQFNAGV